MTKEVGMYYVWATSSPERKEEFVKLINELRSEFGGLHAGPWHLTLVALIKWPTEPTSTSALYSSPANTGGYAGECASQTL